MRSLVILRGSPGSGKSTWVERMGLKNYTLCADDIRMLMESPILAPNETHTIISQKNDKYVWQLLFEILEKRMNRGEFVIVDATHSKSSDFSRYNKLCERYRYRRYYVDFSDVPIDECIRRNNTREEYKRVPEDVIRKMYSRLQTQGKTSGWVEVDKNAFWETIGMKKFNFDKYNKIHVFGDIHGCYEPLKEYFEIYPYKENDMYIFTGDYIDRGIQNKEVLEFLLTLVDKSNILFLEGNHECITLDTEILTENGWKTFENITSNEKVAQYDMDTGLVSYSIPNARIEKISDECVSIKGHNLEQHITKKHNIIYDGKLIPLENVKELDTNRFLKAAKGSISKTYYDENMLKLLTWVVCDGTIVYGEKDFPNSRKCRIQFKLSREDKIRKLEKILEETNIEYTKKESKKCGVNKLQPFLIRIYGEKAREIYEILGKNKTFPKNFQNLDLNSLNIILKEIENTDGHKQNNRLLWSSINKENLDTIQIASILNGYECNIKEIKGTGFNKKTIYLLTLYQEKIQKGISKDVIIEKLPKQKVCCFNMPNGTLITRTNGFVTITGNCWLNYYSLDEYENIKSKTFLYKTAPQIADIDKSSIRKFYRKLGQIAYFEYDGNTYLVSHGGISYLPKELQLVATEQFINGVGDYNVNIDEVWVQNISDYTHKQIHAHRNTFEIDNVTNMSFNLEGKIEFGGCLRVFEVSHGLEPIIVKIKNNVFAKPEEANEYHECKAKIDMPMLEQLRVSKDIKETPLEDNISSFNFTSRAFHNKHWNEATIKARGLFVDTEKDKVVARGYEKFFNVNERRETELEHLLVKFKDSKITCYKKENGFLGIMSYVNGKLFIASKSTNVGEFADMFRKIYEESGINKQQLEKYLSENDVSLTFEVIDTINDPHLIKYDKSKLVLLDIIHNDYEFKREPYEKVVELSKLINCECKSVYVEFDNIRDFHRWYLENTDEDDLSKEDIEGVVIECNGIMTKLKFPYYKFWKFMRVLKDRIAKNKNAQIKLASLYNAEANYFYAWLKKQDEETLKQDIITLRDKYYSEDNK